MKSTLKLRLFLLPLLISCGPAAGPGEQSHTPPDKATPIRLTRVEGAYEATLLFNENRGLLSFGVVSRQPTAGASLPMSRRVEMWRPLLEDLFRERGRSKEYLVAVGEYPEITARIATAAVCSGKWNLSTGRPRSGAPGAAIKELLVDGSLTPELQALFEPLGYSISVRSAEQVMLCRWKEVQSEPPASCRSNVAPDSQVPCGASILFRIALKE